jgi:BioD-like phosphotransacetylase family protein
MVPLLLNSTVKGSGKTFLALGMGLRFKADGHSLGYFKPVGWIPERIHGEIADRDAIFMKRALA